MRNKKLKRILSTLLVFCMVLSYLPVDVFAAGSVTIPMASEESNSATSFALVETEDNTVYWHVLGKSLDYYGLTFYFDGDTNNDYETGGVVSFYRVDEDEAALSLTLDDDGVSVRTTFKDDTWCWQLDIDSSSTYYAANAVSALGAGTYTLKYDCNINEDITIKQKLVIVDDIIITDIGDVSLSTSTTEFNLGVTVYGITNENDLKDLSFQFMLDEEVMASSDGTFSNFEKNSDGKYYFTAHMVVKKTLTEGYGYSIKIDYTGEPNLRAYTDQFSGSVTTDYADIEIRDFVITDVSTSTATLTLANVLEGYNYTIEINNGDYYSETVTAEKSGTVDFEVQMKLNGTVTAMSSLDESFEIRVSYNHGSYDTNEYLYYDNPYISSSSTSSMRISPNYLYANATAFDFEITGVTNYSEEDVITLRTSSSSSSNLFVTATDVTATFYYGEYTVYGNFDVSSKTNTIYYAFYNDTYISTVYFNSNELYFSPSFGVYDTSDGKIRTIFGEAEIYVENSFYIDNASLSIANSKGSKKLTASSYDRYEDGTYVYKFTQSELNTLSESEPYYLVLTAGDQDFTWEKPYYVDLSSTVDYSSITSETFSNFIYTYYGELGNSINARIQSSFNTTNIESNGFDGFAKKITLRSNSYATEDLYTVTGYEVVGAVVNSNYYYVDFTLDKEITTAGYYYLFFDEVCVGDYRIDKEDEPYVSSYSINMTANYISAYYLDMEATYTFDIYKDNVKLSDTPQTMKVEKYSDTESYLVFDNSIFEEYRENPGTYTMRVYMDDMLLGDVPINVFIKAVPVIQIYEYNSLIENFVADSSYCKAAIISDEYTHYYVKNSADVTNSQEVYKEVGCSASDRPWFYLSDGDGIKTIEIVAATDASGSNAETFTTQIYYDSDGDLNIEFENLARFASDTEEYTITVTGDTLYANAWLAVVDSYGTYTYLQMKYAEELADGRHSFSYTLDPNEYVWGTNKQLDFINIVDVRVFFTYLDDTFDSWDNLLDEDSYNSNVKSDILVEDFQFVDFDYIIYPDFVNDEKIVYTNSTTGYDLVGYTESNTEVTVYDTKKTGTVLGTATSDETGMFTISINTSEEARINLYTEDENEKTGNGEILVIDHTAPVITNLLFNFGGGSSASYSTLTWDVSEEVSLYSIISYSYEDESGYAYEVPQDSIDYYDGSGRYYFYFATDSTTYKKYKLTATDMAGNVSDVYVRTSQDDMSPPTMVSAGYSTNNDTLWDDVVSGTDLVLEAIATDDRIISKFVFEYKLKSEADSEYKQFAVVEDGITSTGTTGEYKGTYTWDARGLASDTYTVRVTAYDTDNTATTNFDITIDNTSPAVPADIKAIGTSENIYVSWTYDNAPSDFSHFMVYRSIVSEEGPFSTVTVGGYNYIGYFDTSTDIVNEKTFYYYVIAVDQHGNESAPTAVVSSMLLADSEVPETGDMLPKDGETLTGQTNILVTATDDYRLSRAIFYYSSDNGNNWTEIGSDIVDGQVNNYTFSMLWDMTELESGTYKVKAEVYDTTYDVAELIDDPSFTAHEPAVITRDITVEAYEKAPLPDEVQTEDAYKSWTITWAYNNSLDTENIKEFRLYSVDEFDNKTLVAKMDSATRSKTITNLESETKFVLSVVDIYSLENYSETYTANPQIVDNEDPIAVITPSALYSAINKSFTFSAVNSTDNDKIVSYLWTFGDGSTSTDAIANHTYTVAGEKSVTLKVTDASGNTNEITETMLVIDPYDSANDYVISTFTVVDSSVTGTPAVEGATVIITPANILEDEAGYYEFTATSDENGEIVAVLKESNVNISVAAEGHQPRNYTVTLEGDENATFAKTLGVSSVSVVTGEITVTDMTLDDMKEAGIDLTDPDNSHVVLQEFTFEFTSGSTTISIPVAIYVNEAGLLARTTETIWDETGTYGVMPISENFYLVIYGQTHWLKEMYNVELLVTNNDLVDSLTSLTANLTLPTGLSLATLTDRVQTNLIEMDDVAPESSASAVWYVRGDETGEYHMTADINGLLGSTLISQSYTTNEPVKVYAGDALEISIVADDIAYRGEDYQIDFTLTNVSDKSLYNLTFTLNGSETYKITQIGNEIFETPIDKDTFLMGNYMLEFEAGESITIKFVANDLFNDASLGIDYAEYTLNDIFAITLGDSTTSIPVTFSLRDVEESVFEDLTSTTPLLSSLYSVNEATENAITVADKAVVVDSDRNIYSTKIYKYSPKANDSAVVTFDSEYIRITVDGIEQTTGFTLDTEKNIYVEAIKEGYATFKVVYDTDHSYTENYTISATDVTVGKIEVYGTQNSLAVPTLEEEDSTYTFAYDVYDAFGNIIADSFTDVAWEVAGTDTTGITVVNGTVTVTNTAVAGTYTITATSQGKTSSQEIEVTRSESVATSIEITRNGIVLESDTLVIPTDDSTADYTYVAVVYDQFGTVMAEQSPVWENETISLTKSTELNDITVKATAGDATKSITVKITNINVDFTDVDALVAATTYTYGDTLAKATLPTSGTATIEGMETQLTGTFSYVSGDTVPNAGDTSLTVAFTITSEGDYKDLVITKSYDIEVIAKALSDELSVSGSYTYTGFAQTPTYVVDGLTETTDYTVNVTNNINAGTATISITGTGNYQGTISKDFEIEAKTLTDELSISGTYTFTGLAITPTYEVSGLTVTDDYTVSITNNINVGEATVSITGTGNYQGTISENFNIGKANFDALADMSKSLLFSKENADVTVDILSLPANSGAISFAVKSLTDENTIIASYEATETGIKFTSNIGEENQTATFVVTVTMANYADTDVNIIVTLVNKTPLDITGVSVDNKEYDGKAITYSGTAVADGYTGEFEYIWNTADTLAPTNAGTYTLTVKIPESDETYMGETVIENIEIAKKDLVIKPKDTTSYKGYDLPDEFTLEYSGIITGETVTLDLVAEFVLMNGEEILADSSTNGTYTILWSNKGDTIVSDADNYNVSLADGTLTIKTKSNVNSGGSIVVAPETTTTTEDDDGNVTVNTEATVKTSGTTVTATVDTDAVVEALTNLEDTADIAIEVATKSTTDNVKVSIDSSVIEAFADSAAENLTIKSDLAEITITSEAANSIMEQAEDEITIIVYKTNNDDLNDAQLEAIGDNEIYDLAIMSGDTYITNFGGKSITISLPYTLKDGETAKGVTIYYIDDNGNKQDLKASYSTITGLATATTTHLSYYMPAHDEILAWENPFVDVADTAWYYEAVYTVVSSGFFNGTSDVTFSANANMTRAMVMTVLHRLSGDTTFTGGEFWYTDGMEWAKANGISDGTNPDANVTREQLATMLYRFENATAVTADMSAYDDASSISSWASEAMMWANANGIVTGKTDTTLAPQANATRAEVATMIMRLVK